MVAKKKAPGKKKSASKKKGAMRNLKVSDKSLRSVKGGYMKVQF